MITGRNFSKEYPADRNNCLINETAAKVFGWQDPIGKRIKASGKNYDVIGVIKDYTVFSVFNPNEPHLYRLLRDSIASNAIYSINFAPGKEKEAMNIVKEEFQKFFPDDAFEFSDIKFLTNEGAVKA
jgi:putative ABC transport system permease protein